MGILMLVWFSFLCLLMILLVQKYFCFCLFFSVLKVKVLAAQLCLTLCDPMECSHQVPLSMGFSRQEYWSGLPFPSPGDIPDPGIEPGSPAVQADSLPSEPLGKPFSVLGVGFLVLSCSELTEPFSSKSHAFLLQWKTFLYYFYPLTLIPSALDHLDWVSMNLLFSFIFAICLYFLYFKRVSKLYHPNFFWIFVLAINF